MIEFLSHSKNMPSGRDMAQLARSHKDVTIMFMDIVGEGAGGMDGGEDGGKNDVTLQPCMCTNSPPSHMQICLSERCIMQASRACPRLSLPAK